MIARSVNASRLRSLESRLWVARWSARVWSAIAAGAVLHILVS